ncbi:C50 carotenoid beta cyclase subunit [Pontimonas salivibrio]|uniref:C50 carotenoid beta cyclase subunit n=1 Tax=Pontimonas salivibrio TaxID=1159327 RepID=A0A2L2BQD1_9MICO|nr:lycopene cyclase domain-containing protein [Pontimonas salivibrio]AVG23858.1 C50 carotenoid beta cyclase subunit [Pontimonas salivibrio]
MTYTMLAATGVAVAVILDLFILRTKLLTQGRFWFAWVILVFFQVLTNGWLTGRGIVQYDPEMILGVRIAFAPVEDLAFGFALIVVTLAVWLTMSPEREEVPKPR